MSRGLMLAPLILLATVLCGTGCTNGSSGGNEAPTRSAGPTRSASPDRTATGYATPGAPGALGAPGCDPASPITPGMSGLPQAEGTGHGATLWGLLMFPHPLPARVGDQEKIVWRMTGSGLLRSMTAIGPDGRTRKLAWGPDFHDGSDWAKPGSEWGAGYVFTAAGCWDLRAVRDHGTADVWLVIMPR